MIVTGAAPASPTVLGFLRAALGCQVLPFCGLPGAMTCVKVGPETHYALYSTEKDPGGKILVVLKTPSSDDEKIAEPVKARLTL